MLKIDNTDVVGVTEYYIDNEFYCEIKGGILPDKYDVVSFDNVEYLVDKTIQYPLTEKQVVYLSKL